jgi:hypothetical protein
VEFNNQEDAERALMDRPSFKGHLLKWIRPEERACRKCGNPEHIASNCKQGPTPRKAIMNEPKYTNLANLYARKHVPISTPANFAGVRWADLLKPKPNQQNKSDTNSNPKQKAARNGTSNIEARLDRLEAMVTRIADSLGITTSKSPPPDAKQNQQTTEPITIKDQKQNNNTTNQPTTNTPTNIIKRIINNNQTDQIKLQLLSKAFTEYHDNTTQRIQTLETRMHSLINKLSPINEQTQDPNVMNE